MSDSNLPDTYLIFESLFKTGLNKIDWPRACDYLDTPEKSVRRWYLEKKFPNMARKLLIIKFRGFLPYTKNWQNCRFDKDENIVTPYGTCRPSDIAFVHRYKWLSEQANEQLKALKQSASIAAQEKLASDIARKVEELNQLTAQLDPHHKKRVSM